MRPPCHRTRNRAFIAADYVPERSRRAAVKMCQHCPIRTQCAQEALTGGASLDGSVIAPAAGVVQAGVVCRGDDATARMLAEIAGVDPPPIRKQKRRNHAPEHCVSCRRKMVPWTRYDVPEGFVMHYARGACTNCRSAYRATLDAEREASGKTARLRKPAPPRGRHRTPSHCRDCQRPLIPASHPPREGHMKHHAGGKCSACYKRSRKARDVAA